MKDNEIRKIATSIENRRKQEIMLNIRKPTIGRFDGCLNNDAQTFWIVLSQMSSSDVIPSDNFDLTVSRDAPLGAILIQNYSGEHDYFVGGGYKNRVQIYNRARYAPFFDDSIIASDIVINISDDKNIYTYRNLYDLIKKLVLLNQGIAKTQQNLEKTLVEQKEAQNILIKTKAENKNEQEILLGIAKRKNEEAENLRKKLEKEIEEQRDYLLKAQSFIRQNAELRWQPILDPKQDEIKRKMILNGGTLVINGGPGTGKTTSLIQRIKFLTSSTIEEYKTLSNKQKEILFDQRRSWIFFSPNKLLALFLKNSMAKEELIASDSTVKVWDKHRVDMIRLYGWVDDGKRRIFRFYKQDNKKLSDINFDNKILILEFEKETLQKNIKKIEEKNTKLQYFSTKSINNIRNLVQLYLIIESDRNTKDDEKIMIDRIVKNIFDKIPIKYKTIAYTERQYQETYQKQNKDPHLNLLGYTVEEKGHDVNHDKQTFLFYVDDEKRFKFYKQNNNILGNVVFNDNIKAIIIDFEKYILQKHIEKLQKTNTVSQHFSTDNIENLIQSHLRVELAQNKKDDKIIVDRIIRNIFDDIPVVYKMYRKIQYQNGNKNFNLDLLGHIIGEGNIYINYDEQAFLIYIVNRISEAIYLNYSTYWNELKHSCITTYNINCKPIIAIDEATDFSVIDLLAMHSLKHPEFSSVTLSGDIMQRMTNNGLNRWEEFTNMIDTVQIENLLISYRQSSTLLSLAKKIYHHSTNTDAEYSAYIEYSALEPKPLMKISNDEHDKIKWIASRIREIDVIYRQSLGKLPSVAVFVPREEDIDGFVTELDEVLEGDIPVFGCPKGMILGDSSDIRVYAIDKIKGLEFEAVFFHNLDRLEALENNLLLKYLYVGLSRATFYLGVTMSKNMINKLHFIEDDFFDNTNWKINDK